MHLFLERVDPLDRPAMALELAAAQIEALTADQLAPMLDQRFRLLTGGSRTALPRQQTLRATVDWYRDSLAPAGSMYTSATP